MPRSLILGWQQTVQKEKKLMLRLVSWALKATQLLNTYPLVIELVSVFAYIILLDRTVRLLSYDQEITYFSGGNNLL